MKNYTVEFDCQRLAKVQIDESPQTSEYIRQMVDFWSGSEDLLADNDGDYTKSWLRMLGSFIMRRHRLPKDDEGWCNLDGKFGILILEWHEFDPDYSEFNVEEVA